MQGPRRQHSRNREPGLVFLATTQLPHSTHLHTDTQHTHCTSTHTLIHRYTHSHSHTPTSVPPGSGTHPHGKGPWGGDSDWCCQGTGGQWVVEWH